MKKKYVITGLTGLLLLISGICYSCAYHNGSSAVLIPDRNMTGNNADDLSAETADMTEQTSGSDNPDAEPNGSQVQPTQKPGIYVHICGAVSQPGVYRVDEGSRLVDLIELSGGLTEDAAGDYINQAVQATDGQRIYIPTVSEVEDLPTGEYIQGSQGNESGSGEAMASTVDINTADAEELMKLPGIGEAKAKSIISYRDKNGKFKTIEDIMNIPGIKEGLFNQISALIVAK